MDSGNQGPAERPGLVDRLRRMSQGQITATIIGTVIGGVILAVILAYGFGWLPDASTTEVADPPSTAPTTPTTAPPGPSVLDAEITSLPSCERGLSEGDEWVQVESYPDPPSEWIVPGIVESRNFSFCDGTELKTPNDARLMLDTPLTQNEAAALDDPAAPERLQQICELRRLMRTAGGNLGFGTPQLSSYFTDFVLVPSGKGIGPNRCWPWLASDPTYGSRAAIDRYFAVIAEHVTLDLDLATATSRLEEVTTPAFRSKSGEAAGILEAWGECSDKISVVWMGTPRPSGAFQAVPTQVECERDDGSVKPYPFVLAMAPPDPGGVWRVHWDLDNWPEPAPAST